jgi:hypothetical protein
MLSSCTPAACSPLASSLISLVCLLARPSSPAVCLPACPLAHLKPWMGEMGGLDVYGPRAAAARGRACSLMMGCDGSVHVATSDPMTVLQSWICGWNLRLGAAAHCTTSIGGSIGQRRQRQQQQQQQLSRRSGRVPRRCWGYGRQRQRLARPLRPPAAPPPPRLILGVYCTNALWLLSMCVPVHGRVCRRVGLAEPSIQ